MVKRAATPKTIEIQLQPKQKDLLELIKNHPAPVIGVGGGRGAAKSSGADRCVIISMYEHKLLACMMMRNFDQVHKYHVEAIRREFPWLEKNIKSSSPAKLRIGKSELDFSYAENYEDIERRFRSGNYDLILIDQAEQFTAREIREVRKANRSKGGKPAKIILLFNMRGTGIQDLRKWFYTHEVNKDEDPDDYVFIKFNPWDNVEWVRAALEEDGYTVFDYYAWTDEQRKLYAAERGPYTRQLATDDEVIRQADWEGGWDSLEGAYFANSFDLESTRINGRPNDDRTLGQTVGIICKPWAVHWIAQDWGKSHYCATYWCFRITLSPSEVKEALGWDVSVPLNVTCTYRELIVSELTSGEVARKVVEATPPNERPKIKSFFLSPDAFGERDSTNTIAIQQSKELRAVGMPGATQADNDRIGGWALMGKLLKAAKFKAVDPQTGPLTDVWLISSNCPELLKTIPMLMRDPKNLDDVLKEVRKKRRRK